MTTDMLTRLDEAKQRQAYHCSTPEDEESFDDRLRNAWWAMEQVLRDLETDDRAFERRVFDNSALVGQEENERYRNYGDAMLQLMAQHRGVKRLIKEVIETRRELVEWREHDPLEDDRF